MLLVKSTFVTQTIPYRTVAEIVSGAQQKVLNDREEQPVRLTQYERFVDAVFCRGAKQTTLCHIRQMSLLTATLHLELEKPEHARNPVLIKTYTAQISANQKKLRKLISGDTLEFAHFGERAYLGHGSFLVHQSPTNMPSCIPLTRSEAIKTGLAERVAPAPAVPVDSDVARDGAMSCAAISIAGHTEQIMPEQFELIRKSGELSCAGKVYQVRFLPDDEPAVLCADSDPMVNLIQNLLYLHWIRIQAGRSLERLKLISLNPTLPVPRAFPDTESAHFRIRAQHELDDAWDIATLEETNKFAQIVPILGRKIRTELLALTEIFIALKEVNNRALEQRKTFLVSESRLRRLERHQKRMNKNLENLKTVYWQLFQLAKDCTNAQTQDIVLNRIAHISASLGEITEGAMSRAQAKKLNMQLDKTLLFINHFSSYLDIFTALTEQSPEIVLRDGIKANLLFSDSLDKSIKKLCAVADDPENSWPKILTEMIAVRTLQDSLSALFARKLDAGIELSQKFETLMGEYGEGLNPETGASVYTSKAYSRIVSLKQLRVELLNPEVSWTDNELAEKISECANHLSEIQRETDSLYAQSQSEGFVSYTMYFPELHPDDGTPINFSQWSDDRKGREREPLGQKPEGQVW